jgi:hypothetical protein
MILKTLFHFNAFSQFIQISINSTCLNENCILADQERHGEGGSRVLFWLVEEECEGRKENLAYPCNLFGTFTTVTFEG